MKSMAPRRLYKRAKIINNLLTEYLQQFIFSVIKISKNYYKYLTNHDEYIG